MTNLSKLNYDELCELRERAQSVQKQFAEAEADCNAELQRRLEAAGTTSVTTPGGFKITLVKGENRKILTDVLKDILQPLGLWEKVRIVKEEVDKREVNVLVDSGQVSLEQLAPALEVTPIKPYPKVTKR